MICLFVLRLRHDEDDFTWKNEKTMDVKPADAVWDTAPHMTNFIEACRSRKHADANADIEIGATSAAMCHLANISYRVGRKLQFDAAAMKFTGDAEANKMLTRPYRAPFVVPASV